MNMASVGILLIFALICVSINADTDFVKVECKAQQTGQYGQQSLLECVVRTTADVVNAKIIVVTWKKKGDSKPLMVYNRGEKQLQPGYKFAEPSWNVQNMNVSLLITNTALKDSGNYFCYVMTDSGDHTAEISLDVTAKYNKPKIHYDPKTTGGTLMCESDGGFPKGGIGWFSELKDEWTSSSQMEAKTTGSGLFHLSSKLPLQSGSRFSNYTCIVYNASGGKEGENTYVFPDPPPERQENNAVWRESGKNVTLECSSAGCPTSIKGYDAMYLYQYQDLKEPQQVLYYFSNTELNDRKTPGRRYTGRIQTEGSLQNHTITISRLTVDDSGVYKCIYTKIPSEVECNAYTLFVRGVAPCSRPVEVPCARTSEKSPPLVLIIIGACTISMLVIVINIILIVPRVRRWKHSKRTTAARVRQVSNDNVYEIMTKTGLRTALEESSPDLSQFA